MLNAYMIYSRCAGPSEGAALVFAHTVREARKIGWQTVGRDYTDEYIDFAANRIRNEEYLYLEASAILLAADKPHIIESPRSCKSCEMWGKSVIGEDGLCDECRDCLE